jgi:hypothetical protein
MEENVRETPRSSNDSRKRTPINSGQVETMESKPTFRQRWNDAQPTKTILFWACLGSIVLTIVIGFNWGGWVSAADAQRLADTTAQNAIVQRLAPICIAQFNQDPDKIIKLDEMSGKGSSQRVQYVQEQGWATISGEERPDRRVADACAKLLLEMNP